MNCREFNENHVAFVDDTLSGVELIEMQRHIAECERCARLNSNVRRALVVAWNLPRIEPSADFAERLQARLRASILESGAPKQIRRRVGVAVSLATAAMLGYIALTLYKVDSTRDLVLAPVVATVPESEMTLITAPPPAIVTSAPAGLSMWPAALLAEQAQVHFVRASLEVPTASR
jgi:anti-sigma factor RsiW